MSSEQAEGRREPSNSTLLTAPDADKASERNAPNPSRSALIDPPSNPPSDAATPAPTKPPSTEPEVDEFGLPIRKRPPRSRAGSPDGGASDSDEEGELEAVVDEASGKVVFRRRVRSRTPPQRRVSPAPNDSRAEEGEDGRANSPAQEPTQLKGDGNGPTAARRRSRSADRRSGSRTSSADGSEGFVSAASSRRSSIASASHQGSFPNEHANGKNPEPGRQSNQKDHPVSGADVAKNGSSKAVKEPGRESGPREICAETNGSKPSMESSVESSTKRGGGVAADVEVDEHKQEAGTNSPSIAQRARADTLAQIVEAGADSTHAPGGVSDWSHQALAPRRESAAEKPEADEWQAMPALGEFDVYDDHGRIVARGAASDNDSDGGSGKGGAKKGYTRVQDDDAVSATSLDEETGYLFKEQGGGTGLLEDEEQRDALQQMQATKDLLTEGQRIAYVGVTRLALARLVETLESLEREQAVAASAAADQTTKEAAPAKGEAKAKAEAKKELKKAKALSKETKKNLAQAAESTKKWGQKMMVRLYGHMEIDSSEQAMIEQLAEHGVQPADLTPALMQNSRVKNPMADLSSTATQASSTKSARSGTSTPTELGDDVPPPYSAEAPADLPEVRNPDQLPGTRKIDIDLRWTALCDLFLVLIADSAYDARSRTLLERVGAALGVPWVDICRFEKRVTDALEMQEAAAREDWDEGAHIEHRRKLALRKRYMVMGLATVGGGLVIGLSAGLLAPVIGAGLATGFGAIGVAGTGTFFGGVGGTALIAGIGVTTGSTIGVRAGRKRMGPVRTFEYRPLHNNKRVNLIVTVSGWMTGTVDDVRLPFSTIDPVMGDIYSVLWEPELLCSMGDTIRILATEALTQGLQHALAATVLATLMAGLALPIVLTKLSYLLDNPWNVSLDRAESAGLILADSLIDRNLGVRPVTLVGFSLGAKVIFSCLKELAKRDAYGLVQNVYLFGAPIVARREDYLRARAIVAGRFVNGYATNDWILGYLFRATSGGIGRVAGMASVEGIPGLENFNVTEHVPGHMVYREAMPRLLREVGWEVTSDEFAEIEDPDPDNHAARQRELIRELGDARREAAEDKGRAFGLWKRSRLAEKRTWETYDVDKQEQPPAAAGAPPEKGAADERVLFDVEAIRRELAREQLEVKQLESTLPPMQLDLRSPPPDASGPTPGPTTAPTVPTVPTAPAGGRTPLAATREVRSADAATFPTLRRPDTPASDRSGHAAAAVLPESADPAAPLAVADTPTENPKSAPLPAPGAARPVLLSAATMPLEQNAWADEEEDMGEGWGREKEGDVVMSFE